MPNGEPTNWELARRIDELARTCADGNDRLSKDITNLADALRLTSANIEKTYVRKDVFQERIHVTDVQLEGIEDSVHNHAKRLDANDKDKEDDRKTRDSQRRAFLYTLAAVILSCALTSVVSLIVAFHK